jgi:hypothetical protein
MNVGENLGFCAMSHCRPNPYNGRAVVKQPRLDD